MYLFRKFGRSKYLLIKIMENTAYMHIYDSLIVYLTAINIYEFKNNSSASVFFNSIGFFPTFYTLVFK